MMNHLIEAAARFQTLLESERQRFCFIGGLAVQRWGEPRVTRDVDATIFVGFGFERPAIDLLLKHYPGRVPNAGEFALRSRVMLLEDRKAKTGIDVSLGAFAFEKGAVDRSTLHEYLPKIYLRTCSAEDLIVFKAFAARDLDWHDIKGILIRQQGRLDFDLVERELVPLVGLKEEPEILNRWWKLRDRYR